jgi:hypothetical protein
MKNQDGKWFYLEDGTYKNSNIPVALDCWNHVQISLDAASRSYQIVIQPVGEMPAVLAAGKISGEHPAGFPRFVIKTENLDNVYQVTRGSAISLVNFSCIDNIRLTGN